MTDKTSEERAEEERVLVAARAILKAANGLTLYEFTTALYAATEHVLGLRVMQAMICIRERNGCQDCKRVMQAAMRTHLNLDPSATHTYVSGRGVVGKGGAN